MFWSLIVVILGQIFDATKMPALEIPMFLVRVMAFVEILCV